VAGALAWWGPIFITYGLTTQDGAGDVQMSEYVSSSLFDIFYYLWLIYDNNHVFCIFSVSLKFGIVTMLSGLIGVPLGSYAAQKFRTRNARADPLICAFGLLASTPLMFLASITAQYHTVACFLLIFFAEVCINTNCAISSNSTLQFINYSFVYKAVPEFKLVHCSGYFIGKFNIYFFTAIRKLL
jgi:hypothetical protein